MYVCIYACDKDNFKQTWDDRLFMFYLFFFFCKGIDCLENTTSENRQQAHNCVYYYNLS